jgi:hypothetical protein
MATVATERNSLTVTEALAEIKTLGKRLEKRRENVFPYIVRQRAVTDPLIDDVQGGSPEFIRRERQAAKDLEERLVRLRVAIQAMNQRETISINGEERTIAAWLTWRKEILPGRREFIQKLRQKLERVRLEAAQKQVGVINVDASQQGSAKYLDLLVNISEADLAGEAEHLELVVGTLDGALSLKNATTVINI